MYFLKQLGCTMFMALALVATAASQATLSVSPGPLTVGSQAKITYSNPNRAGELVPVEINDCGVAGLTDVVFIRLNNKGEGSVTWTVPSWLCAIFEAPDAPAVARAILP